MVYPKIPLAQSILQIFLAKGIRTVVISPGSRNAPLTIGFVNHPDFTCYSIADERCAGFFALGMAQQTQKPVALLCTSGSALLNYYPAISEAFYSQIPLIVLSADRPQSKIDIGDGQTIRQENVFSNHCLYNANLTEEVSEENDRKINEAIQASIIQKGPVHINAPFEEPLYETVSEWSVKSFVDQSEPKVIEETLEDLSSFASIWNSSKKKMILVGVCELEANAKSINVIANDDSIVVFTEKTSNIHHPSFVSNIDTIITPFEEEDFKFFQPDILVTFGGMVVSKRIKAFLRKFKPTHHWHIDPLRAYDTFGALSHHFKVLPDTFFEAFYPLTQKVTSNYSSRLCQIKNFRKLKHDAYISQIPYSDFKVFDKVISSLPKNIQLQVSNSSAIRYVQLVPIDPSISVYSNRGTSGIDGSTSTAIGAALVANKPTVFLTGDISFFYDSNALWNNYIPKDFKIIIINNGGGGIFRILPGHEENPVFNTFFETSHQLNAKNLCKMFGLSYFSACNEESLEEGIQQLFNENDQPAVFEVFTPTTENDKVLLQYFKSLN